MSWPSKAPASPGPKPTKQAITSSNGQRLCAVGSRTQSTNTRAITAAGTAAPAMAMANQVRAAPNNRSTKAANGTTTTPAVRSAFGRLT